MQFVSFLQILPHGFSSHLRVELNDELVVTRPNETTLTLTQFVLPRCASTLYKIPPGYIILNDTYRMELKSGVTVKSVDEILQIWNGLVRNQKQEFRQKFKEKVEEVEINFDERHIRHAQRKRTRMINHELRDHPNKRDRTHRLETWERIKSRQDNDEDIREVVSTIDQYNGEMRDVIAGTFDGIHRKFGRICLLVKPGQRVEISDGWSQLLGLNNKVHERNDEGPQPKYRNVWCPMKLNSFLLDLNNTQWYCTCNAVEQVIMNDTTLSVLDFIRKDDDEDSRTREQEKVLGGETALRSFLKPGIYRQLDLRFTDAEGKEFLLQEGLIFLKLKIEHAGRGTIDSSV